MPGEDPIVRLLKENDWLRRLAGSLVLDPHLADDIHQDAALIALQTPPADPGGERSWLRRVARNLCSRHYRDRARAKRRERLVARCESVPSSAELSERLELQRRVAEAIQALDEPMRTTVVLRFHDDLSPTEIARRTDTPPSTVRVRLKRALELLRQRLQEGQSDRPWMGALLYWAGIDARSNAVATGSAASLSSVGHSVGSSSLASIGWGFTMMKTTGVVAALVVLFLAFQFAFPNAPGDLEPKLRSTEVSQVASNAPPGQTSESKPTPGKLAPEPAPSVQVPIVPEPAPTTERVEAETWVVAHLVDQNQRPLSGATLALATTNGEPVVGDSSDIDGLVRVQIDLGVDQKRYLAFQATKRGFAVYYPPPQVVRGGQETDLGELTLLPGATITGRVSNTTGYAVAGAQVLLADLEQKEEYDEALFGPDLEFPRRHFATLTATDGSFTLPASPGNWRVSAATVDSQWAFSLPLTVEAGQSRSVDLTVAPLESSSFIAGDVQYPDGTPCSHAKVELLEPGDQSWGFPTKADAMGRFFLRLKKGGAHQLRAQDPAKALAHVRQDGVVPGDRQVRIRLKESRTTELVVLDLSGVTVPDYQVRIVPVQRVSEWDLIQRIDGPHADGRVTLQVQNEPYIIEVTARFFKPAVLGPFDSRDAPELLECRVEELASIQGVVVDSDGEPIHAYLYLGIRVPDDKLTRLYGFPLLFKGFSNSSQGGSTDAAGAFRMGTPFEGEYYISVRARGWPSNFFGPYEFGPDQGIDDLELVLTRGGSVEGYIIDPTGKSTAGFRVSVSNGAVGGPSTTVDQEGHYRFDNLSAGRYMIRYRDPNAPAGSRQPGHANIEHEVDRKPGEDPFEWAFDVHEDRVTRHNIQLPR